MDLKLVENIDESVVILLEDTELEFFHNLRMGPYSFSANVVDYEERFFLHFNPPVEIATTDQNCEGDPGKILLEQNGNIQWNLRLLDNRSKIIQSKARFNGTLQMKLEPGDYTLQLTDTFGYKVIKSVVVGTKDQVYADFECDDCEAIVTEPVSFRNTSEGAVEYKWDFGNGFFSDEKEPIHQYRNPGIYEVILRAFSVDCEKDISKRILVKKEPITLVSSEADTGIHIYGNKKRIYIRFNLDRITQAQINVYEITGRQIIRQLAETAGVHSFPVDDPGNIHLVKVLVDGEVFSSKVLLK